MADTELDLFPHFSDLTACNEDPFITILCGTICEQLIIELDTKPED